VAPSIIGPAARRSGVALAALLLAAVAAGAQSNTERMANDRYSRSHDYDLLHERIEIGGFDWERRAFAGRVELTLRALRPSFDSVIVDAGRLLEPSEVTDGRGAPLAHSRHGDSLVVRLAKPVGFGDSVRIRIAYRGTVENGKGLTFIEADSLPFVRPRQVWSQGEAMNNHLWFPTYDFPNDRTTWELLATVPQGFTAVSNGRLVKDRKNKDRTHTVHWSQEQPVVTYLVSLVVAPLVRMTDRWKQVPLEYYVYPADTARARRTFAYTGDIIDAFVKLTGVAYPWAKYAQTTVADFFGGQENVSATTLVDWLPDSRSMADRPWFYWELVPHELSHQWFGDYVTTANWANMWINEGFAQFMTGQYWSLRQGRMAAEDFYLTRYHEYLSKDRQRRMPLAALASNNIYPKGALVLDMLLQYLGPERFWASVHRFLTDHALGVAVTDDFRQAILAATGENLDWFFDQWFYQAGHPELEVSAQHDSATATLRLIVKQTQVDSAKADSTGVRYSTPLVFRMPVTIRVATSHGDRVAQARLEHREDTVVVSGVEAPPDMVVFDVGNTILKTLVFPQPASWLANQLERDPNLWNRSWVIGQLSEHRRDTTALRALAQAAIAADYPLIRAQALTALIGIPADSLLRMTVRWSLADTSALVRAASLDLLAETGGDPALARSAWQKDTSYEVRASALVALVEMDSVEARAALRQALETTSYRNLVENTALGLVARAGDSSFVPMLDSILPRLPQAATTLARLANRGSGSALESLVSHLEAPQPAVRRAVLRAFESPLRRDQAVARLRAVQGDLKDEEVKKGVAELLERLQK
jgi:aminopeptidase N